MDLEALLLGSGRVLTSADLRRTISRRRLDRALRTGELVRLHPGIYACGPNADQPAVRWRAALAYLQWHGVLSHSTGLAAHGLVGPHIAGPVHVVAGRDCHLRSDPSLVIHRRVGFTMSDAVPVSRHGLAALPLERCLVDGWQQRSFTHRREALILAVRERRTTSADVQRALHGVAVADRGHLEHLLELLAVGCHSELEIWGHLHIFTAAGMPTFTRQHRVAVDGAAYFLDLAHIESKTAVELDGWRYHGDREQRDRDLRRDACLAGAGWLTLRYSSSRLHGEPLAVRREVLAVIAARSLTPLTSLSA
jgi:very-short-patch-repair endonuclease